MLDLGDTSLTTIQACVLLGSISIIEGKSAAEAVYYSVASRIALLLDERTSLLTTALRKRSTSGVRNLI
jgi:hypothetical protein